MKKICAIIFFLISINLIAQKEANYWFFGQNAGLNFNSNPPTSIIGSLVTNEGCSSFSDKNGDLLFYSDGTRVWDKNHNVMPNGNNLLGNPSSTQSAIIVPHPGLSNQFYIFTVGTNYQGVAGLNSYIVDIEANGGLGDVVSGPSSLSDGKDIVWTEKVTSVKGAECNTFWVISLVNSTFYSYKVDLNGLNPTPVISTVDFFSVDVRGYLKVSPDGKKLASATFNYWFDENDDGHAGVGKLHLYSFNDSSGKISNDGEELISNTSIDGEPYGVEFSTNSTKLYCSTHDGSNNKLYQFDLNRSSISSSKTLIKSQIGYRGGLQLAPNGKIYATVPPSYTQGTRYLDVINAPDALGINCDYKTDAIDLGNTRSMQGLPPFIASILLPIEIRSVEKNNEIITNQTVKLCVGSSYNFNSENLPGNPEYSWTHNGIEINENAGINITNLQPSDAGIYKLTVIVDDCGFLTTYEGQFEIEAYYPPVITTTFTYDQCDIDEDTTDGVTLFNLNTKVSEITNDDPDLEVYFYESQNNLDNDSPIPNPSEYSSTSNPNLLIKVVHNISGCFTTGVMELNVYPTSLDNYPDFYVCENNSAVANAMNSLGSGDGTFDFESKRQSIQNIFVDPNVEVEFYENTSDTQLQINPISGLQEYIDTEIFVRISNKKTKNCISVGKFSLIVNALPIPKGNEEEIILCVSNPRDVPQPFTVQLDGETGTPNDLYQWYLNDNLIAGATNSTYDANAEGIYKVEATRFNENIISDINDDTNCMGFNSFRVKESNPPVISSENITVQDDSVNNSISIAANNIGIGNYEFALEGENSYYNFQDEPFFDNVTPGIYTLLSQDKNGCGDITQIDVSVIGYPKFFTPNNDGVNDTWKVLGVNENFYSSSQIFIFNRYGKLLTKINPKGEGWDGLLNGKYLPSTDYWFSVELIDSNGNIKIRKGHFSLIRK